jgi:hypothetical protein
MVTPAGLHETGSGELQRIPDLKVETGDSLY